MMRTLRNIGVRARLLLLIAAAMLPLIGLVAAGLVVSFQDAEQEAHRNISNETRLGAASVSRVFDDAREFLATLRHMPQILDTRQPDCNLLLAGLKAERPQFISVGVIGADRTLSCHSRGKIGTIFGDEKLFEEAINARGNRLVVGDFMISRVTGKPTIAVAMRLPPSAANGAGGLVFATLNLPMIEHDIKLMSRATGHSVAIVQPRSSRILVNWPHVAEFGTVARDFALFGVLRATRNGGTATVPDIEGDPTIYGFEAIQNAGATGLWLVVGVSPDEVYGAVQRRLRWALTTGAVTLVVALASAALLGYWMHLRPIALLSRSAQRIGAGTFAVRTGMDRWQAPEYRRLGSLLDTAARTLAQAKVAEEAVAAGERQFRLVAENTVDMISCVDAAGKRTLVTGASRRILGYEPEELLDQHPLEIVVPEDQAFVASLLDTFRAGGEVNGARYRMRRKDGSVIWVELSGRPMDAVGSCVVSVRDVDQRQRTEEALAEANRQLEMLAATDDLTRLANRRTFNRRLEETFAAADAGRDMSLLLLDVDRFKAFNDRYGHPAGDRCLRAVSEALAACIRADDELGARYGGEELALILPGAGPAEAMERAETLRRAVAALRIPHEDADDGYLTVSIGVASLSDIGPEGAGPQDIIEKADEALYAAKAGGRNQVRSRAA